ncbi:MAG: PUA domain-containing protein [Thermoplasmatota archaeon]
MKDIALKRRARVRSKEARNILAWMSDEFGISIDGVDAIESGTLEGKRAYVIENKLVAVEGFPGLLLTLHGIILLKPGKRWITVDMGAVKFLANGADVMSPGIVDADPDIDKDDIVWIRDEKNLRPLCVGKAIMTGPEMISSKSGKAVKTLHFVGDPIWNADL